MLERAEWGQIWDAGPPFLTNFCFVLLLSDYVRKFATEEALRDYKQVASSDSESSMSDFSENEAQDMEL